MENPGRHPYTYLPDVAANCWSQSFCNVNKSHTQNVTTRHMMVCRTGVSDRAVWHFAATVLLQFTKCHTTAMSFSVLESIFPVWLQMLVPMSPSNETGILVHSKFEESALPFPNTNCSRLELAIAYLRCNEGLLAAVLSFLLQDFGRVCAALLKKVIFLTSYFLHVAVQCRFTSLLLLWRPCFFPGPRRSRTSQVWLSAERRHFGTSWTPRAVMIFGCWSKLGVVMHSLGDGTLIRISLAASDEMVSGQTHVDCVLAVN